MKFFSVAVFFVLLIVDQSESLKRDEYIQTIENLSMDKDFVAEYRQWTSKLFADPDYFFGEKLGDFPCPIPSSNDRDEPTTIHHLRPADVQCVAAIGDSLTAALGANAATPIGLFTENRGISWCIGGDYTVDTAFTLPNILRLYNPNLKGFSTKQSLIFGKGQNSSNNGLNAAESGDVSSQMIDQAQMIYKRIVTESYCNPKGQCCDLQNDWKVFTLFIGGNDLCLFCQDPEAYSPENYLANIEKTLDYLQENFPRTFVNVVLVLDVRHVKEMNAGGTVCALLHKNTCPCAAYPSANDTILLNEYLPLYRSKLVDLINTGKYDSKEDFTVVIQPFLANTTLPFTLDGEIDYRYFAPDCFHFSAQGHNRAALALWNNMIEPVGEKRWEWHPEETIECPTAARPYFATRKNSPQSFERY